MSSSVLIVGASHGGVSLAAALRQSGYAGKIHLIGAEPQLPYHRPPLSKTYLSGKPAQTVLQPEAYYQKQEIDLRLGTSVTAIDVAKHSAELSSGEQLVWDDLVFATGSTARQLSVQGGGLAGVYYLRTMTDADRIKTHLATATAITLIGGGYIGLELAASLRQADKPVRILEMEQRILQRVTSPAMSAYYHQVHSRHGVEILTGKMLAKFSGESGRLSAAHCEGGDVFPTDMAIVGIGVQPAIGLAEHCGVDCDNGILVDERCRTSIANIWAIGDCTNHPNPTYQRRMRIESVPNALEQARVVADNLVGKDRTHDAIPWFWSDQYDLKLQMAGFSSGADTEVVRGREADDSFARFYWREGRLMGVDAVNAPKEFVTCRKLLASGASVDPEKIADPNTDLKTLV